MTRSEALCPDEDGIGAEENSHGHDDKPKHGLCPPERETQECEGERRLAPKVGKDEEAGGDVENQRNLGKILWRDVPEVRAISKGYYDRPQGGLDCQGNLL